MEINYLKEIKNTTLPQGTGCFLSPPSPGSFPNTQVHTVNAELEKLEGRAPVETTGESIHEEKAFCMTGFKLEGTSTGEIAPHTKTEPRKKWLC